MSDKYEDYSRLWMAEENGKYVQACADIAGVKNDDSFRLAIRLAVEHYGKWLAAKLEEEEREKETCEWVERGGIWFSACNNESTSYFECHTYCPACGRRIVEKGEK